MYLPGRRDPHAVEESRARQGDRRRRQFARQAVGRDLAATAGRIIRSSSISATITAADSNRRSGSGLPAATRRCRRRMLSNPGSSITACATLRRSSARRGWRAGMRMPTLRQLQLIQIRFNFPILVLSSILLGALRCRQQQLKTCCSAAATAICGRASSAWSRKQMGVRGERAVFLYQPAGAHEGVAVLPAIRHRTAEGGAAAGRYLRHRLVAVAFAAKPRHPYAALFHPPPATMDEYEKMRPTPAGIDVHSIVGRRRQRRQRVSSKWPIMPIIRRSWT